MGETGPMGETGLQGQTGLQGEIGPQGVSPFVTAPDGSIYYLNGSVGVGTDSRSCSDNLNMFEAMRLASFTSRVRGPDYRRWLGTDEALRMATEGSARALGLQGKVGRLEPG